MSIHDKLALQLRSKNTWIDDLEENYPDPERLPQTNYP